MIDAIGNALSWEDLLLLTKLQCLAWTAADLVIVFALIRIANFCRHRLGLRPHRFSYAVLGSTLLFVPLVAMTSNGGVLFLVELMITVPHFLLILYLLGVNRRHYPRALAGLGANARPDGPMADPAASE